MWALEWRQRQWTSASIGTQQIIVFGHLIDLLKRDGQKYRRKSNETRTRAASETIPRKQSGCLLSSNRRPINTTRLPSSIAAQIRSATCAADQASGSLSTCAGSCPEDRFDLVVVPVPARMCVLCCHRGGKQLLVAEFESPTSNVNVARGFSSVL